jgi:ADP-dependent phosphofructokinase/glucokinase
MITDQQREYLHAMARDCNASINDLVDVERQRDYGDPVISMERIADLWNGYIKAMRNQEIQSSDVALMMCLLKIAREINSHKQDNIDDAMGYLKIAAMCLEVT